MNRRAAARPMLVAVLVSSLLAACAQPRQCDPIELLPAAAVSLASIEQGGLSPLVWPVSCNGRLRVTQVFVDALPEAGGQIQRLNIVVDRAGERGYVFSQTAAVLAFTRIPPQTHRIEASEGSVTASGFAGPAGTGDDIAYLRWRSDDVTYELHATLRLWLTEQDIVLLAKALIASAAAD